MNIASFNFWIVCAIPLLSLTSQTFLHPRIIVLLFFCMSFSYSWKLNETFQRRVTQFCNQEKRLVNVARGRLYVSVKQCFGYGNISVNKRNSLFQGWKAFSVSFTILAWNVFESLLHNLGSHNKLCTNILSLSISHQLFPPINCRWINDTLKRKAGLKQFSPFQQFS